MLILDTNVLSELLKPTCSPVVVGFLNGCRKSDTYITTITEAELLAGIAVLPDGQRKTVLSGKISLLRAAFTGRCLGFESKAAEAYAELYKKARSSGRGFPVPDAFIAAIASAHLATMVTRDVSPFKAVGLPVLNPWLDAPPHSECGGQKTDYRE